MTDDDKLIGKILDMFRLCRIEEHNPGRITLKLSALDLPRLAMTAGGIGDIEGKISHIPGIERYEPNIGWTRASVVVWYDPSVFPYQLWEDLCALSDHPELESSIVERIRALFNGAGTWPKA